MTFLFTRCLDWLTAQPRRFFTLLFLASVLLYTAHIAKVKSVVWGDSRYYYAYTRSLVMDHDLNFANEAFRPVDGFPNPPFTSPQTHRVVNKFSPGAGLIWIPGFVVGEMLSVVLHTAGWHIPTDGYGLLTEWVTAISTIGLSMLGMWLTFLVLKRYLSQTRALMVIGILYATTQMFYYTSLDPLNSHTASFALSALLLWLVERLRHTTSYSQATTDQGRALPISSSASIFLQLGVLIGLVGGWLTLVRNQDLVVLIPVGLWIVSLPGTILERAKRVLVMAVPFSFVMSIQAFVVWYLYGQLNSPYFIQGEKLLWWSPDFGRVLFSWGNGLFVFAPVTFICLIGLFLGRKKLQVLSWLGLSIFFLQLYVIAAWEVEILGGPYGSRMFISTLPWLSLGLVFFVDYLEEKKQWWVVSWLGVGALVINDIVQTLIMMIRH